MFLLREKMGMRRWGALLVGLLGTLVILRPGFQEITVGYWWAIGSTLMTFRPAPRRAPDLNDDKQRTSE